MADESSIFDQISSKHVQSYPFPHAVVLDALPVYLVEQLLATRPALGQVAEAYSHAERSAGQVFARPGEKIHLRSAQLLNDQFASAVWKDTVRKYLSAFELAKLLSAFAPAIRSQYPQLEREWGKISDWTIGQRFVDSSNDFVLLADVQLSYHAPSPVRMVAERGPHLKVTNKLLICQYFLKIAEDQSAGGDLLLYGVKENSSLTFGKDQQVVNRESLILAKRIEYKANTAVAFLNTPRSFQAFSEHGGTIHPCFYLNIVLEFAKPIFSI
jgi:hypothetical protein